MAATDTGGKFGAGLREALGAGRLGVQEISLGATRQGNGYGHEQAQGAGAGAHGHGDGLGYGQVETDDDMSTEKSKPGMSLYVLGPAGRRSLGLVLGLGSGSGSGNRKRETGRVKRECQTIGKNGAVWIWRITSHAAG